LEQRGGSFFLGFIFIIFIIKKAPVPRLGVRGLSNYIMFMTEVSTTTVNTINLSQQT